MKITPIQFTLRKASLWPYLCLLSLLFRYSLEFNISRNSLSVNYILQFKSKFFNIQNRPNDLSLASHYEKDETIENTETSGQISLDYAKSLTSKYNKKITGLYYLNNCPSCKRVLKIYNTLDEKDKFQLKDIKATNPNSGQSYLQELLTLTPTVKMVPALEIDTQYILRESSHIIELLNQLFKNESSQHSLINVLNEKTEIAQMASGLQTSDFPIEKNSTKDSQQLYATNNISSSDISGNDHLNDAPNNHEVVNLLKNELIGSVSENNQKALINNSKTFDTNNILKNSIANEKPKGNNSNYASKTNIFNNQLNDTAIASNENFAAGIANNAQDKDSIVNTTDTSKIPTFNFSNQVSHSSNKETQQTDPMTPKMIFVGNITWEATPEDLEKCMSLSGNVTNVSFIYNRLGKHKGCAIVTYNTAEEASQSIKMLNNTFFKGRKINVQPYAKFPRSNSPYFSNSSRASNMVSQNVNPRKSFNYFNFHTPYSSQNSKNVTPASSDQHISNNVIFVWNLPNEFVNDDLEHLFSSEGYVRKAHIVPLPDLYTNRLGIVMFSSEQDAQKAKKKYNKRSIHGNNIEISMANQNQYSKNADRNSFPVKRHAPIKQFSDTEPSTIPDETSSFKMNADPDFEHVVNSIISN